MTTAAVKKRKRIVLVCRLVKQGKTLANVATLFNIGKSTDHDKIKNEGKLQTFLTEVEDGDSIKNKTLGRALDPRANGTWLSKLTGSSYLRRTDN